MKTSFPQFFIQGLAFLILINLTACKKVKQEPSPTPNPTPTTCTVVYVNPNNFAADITTPTTWTSDKLYVVTAYVTITSTLTIQPGTIIKLNNDGYIRTQGNGKILANGTANNRIVFTSLFDDTKCGDTNGDGAATAASKGDWYSIYLNGGTNHSFTYCDILYAGRNFSGYNNAVVISVAGSSFTFDNCVFAHTLSSTSSNAYAFYGGFYMQDPSVSVFTNNVFYDNDRPIYCDVNYSIHPSNSYSNPANPLEKNTRNGIYMYVSGAISGTVNLLETDVPHVIEGYTQRNQGVMNIGPGVVLKFPSTGNGMSRNDPSNLIIDASAFLTSYKDDVHGGDTNGDGSSSLPAIGDWYGVSIGGSVWLQGPNILYAAN